MKDADTGIAYQNKDIVSKMFGAGMEGKPLSLFGLDTEKKVISVQPTNIPIVEARELRIDNLFELEDGSIAILDYESDYKEENFFKYGNYIINVSKNYWRSRQKPDIHMMVIYTADIENAETIWHRTACDIRTETACLVNVDSEAWFDEAQNGIEKGLITDEVLMHLILYPLTFKGNEKKQIAIRRSIDLAKTIEDKELESFVLAGVLAFTDKVIDERTRKEIKEVLRMTQVGKMLFDEGRQEGDLARAKKTALKMLARGDSEKEIADVLELPISMIEAWKEEVLCAI